MSDLVFPTLPGLDIVIEIEPYDGVQVDETQNGKEVRSTWETYERTKYKLKYNFLRDGVATPEWQRLVGFRKRHGGQLDSFLFVDPQDNAVAAMPFGVGDGSTLTFQLQRTLVPSAYLSGAALRSYWPVMGDAYEPITSLNGNPSVFVDTGSGPVLKTLGVDYTLPGFGAVLWASAPAVNAILTWTGSYYRRCRFADPSLPTPRIVYGVWSAPTVNLVSVKEEEVPPMVGSGGGGIPHFETPSGIFASLGATGTLSKTPIKGTPVIPFWNGEAVTNVGGLDFTLSGNSITPLSPNQPVTGDSYVVLYYATT